MITEKLLAVIEYSGLSQTAFAKKVGSTQANLWRQLNGQRVNVATLVAVAQQFPEIACNYAYISSLEKYSSTRKFVCQHFNIEFPKQLYVLLFYHIQHIFLLHNTLLLSFRYSRLKPFGTLHK